MKNGKVSVIMLMLLLIVGVVAGCSGGGGGDGGGAAATAALSTLCGPAYNFTAGKSCDGGLCKSGLVYGDANDNTGPYSMGFSFNDGMCTRVCSTSADCQGISFATANNVTVAVEHWTCMTTSSGNYCAVSVSAPTGGGNSCTGCGGAFCSGNCIGCPGC
jgi:hypothetical protein